jgi:hypothetical protein
MVEIGDTLLKVLCDDLLWNMAEPVGHLGHVISRIADRQYDKKGLNVERRSRVEIAIWEYLEPAKIMRYETI